MSDERQLKYEQKSPARCGKEAQPADASHHEHPILQLQLGDVDVDVQSIEYRVQ
jgi:hypothetical protein